MGYKEKTSLVFEEDSEPLIPAPHLQPSDPRRKYYQALQKQSKNELKFHEETKTALPSQLFVRNLYDSFSDLSIIQDYSPHDSVENLNPAQIQGEDLPKDDKVNTQSSLVTIFSIVNTMLGSSLLALPWGFLYSGFAGGIGVVFFVGTLAWYTAYLIVKNGMGCSDFSEVCRDCLGKWGEYVAIVTSIFVLIGAAIAYDILMSTSLHDLVVGVIQLSQGDKHPPSFSWWTGKTVPIFLAAFLYPLCNLKSFVVLVKFNTVGILAVFYLVAYIPTISFVEGSIDFPKTQEMDIKFFYLAGILTLGFFIHNCIVSILKTNRNQENNVRDLGLAYFIVGLLYAGIGSIAYLAFSTNTTISQDILTMMKSTNIPTMIARAFVVIQLVSVYPLLLIIVRLQFFGLFWRDPYPSWIHVAVLNIGLVAITTIIAAFYPKIATVLRFTGAICGLIYVFILPISTHWILQKRRDELTWTSLIFHGILILIGFTSAASQFIP